MYIFKDCEEKTGKSKQGKFLAAMKKIFELCAFFKSADEQQSLRLKGPEAV